MDKTTNWLVILAGFVVIGGCLVSYLNLRKNHSYLSQKPVLRIRDIKILIRNVQMQNFLQKGIL